jgi:hypothetical protein
VTVGEQARTDPVRVVTEHMTSTYGAIVPPAFVAAVVREAERDLRGQVVPGALGEMLHRLVAVRLEDLVRAGTFPGLARTGPGDE